MSLSDDLIGQAARLVALDPRKPKQANLRRAISSCYYALFHEIVDAATRRISRFGALDPEFRLTYRRFEHRTMKEVAEAFAKRTGWPTNVGTLPDPLVEFARTFVELQERRHAADYDPALRLDRTAVRQLIQDADVALRGWRGLSRGDRVRNYFLLAMLLGKPRP